MKSSFGICLVLYYRFVFVDDLPIIGKVNARGLKH